MMRNRRNSFIIFVLAVILFSACKGNSPGDKDSSPSYGGNSLYTKPAGVTTRWSTFENPGAEKGKGALTNRGAKGHSWERFNPGETKTLLDVKGAGVVNRIWMTLNRREPNVLRGLRIEMYWDGAKTPAVSAPLGDFFGGVFGVMVPFQNELFCSPEGRSFNCFIPMPFRTGAKIIVVNDTKEFINQFFYEVDFESRETIESDAMYFHATWRRERYTTVGKDFEIMPEIKGNGRYLGANIGVITRPENTGWWGEGQVKVYMDGDTANPTLVGTGAEDYIGEGYGMAYFSFRYQGAYLVDNDRGRFSFYRFHIPDPVYFTSNCRVTMQQLGGLTKEDYLSQKKKGAPVQSVSYYYKDGPGESLIGLMDKEPPIEVDDPSLPETGPTGGVFYYRSDDWSAVAYFYMDKPENGIVKSYTLEERTIGIEGNEPKKK